LLVPVTVKVVILVWQQCKLIERVTAVAGDQLLDDLPVSRRLHTPGQDRSQKKKKRKETEKDGPLH
jgi:hypothetical protein